MIIFYLIVFLGASLLLGLLLLGFYPKQVQPERVFSSGKKNLLSASQQFKVLSYNVQFMAGKEYVFWFDVPDANGPDSRPSKEDITKTTAEIAKVIIDESPDFIFLQEIDDGAKRTDQQDQLKALLTLLPKEYAHHTSAFYWKSTFVPHPKVLGSAGMKLSIVSKYFISNAERHQLALTPNNLIAKHLGVKRAILKATVPLKEGGQLALLNTHLEAFSKQSDTLKKQVAQVSATLSALDKENTPWVIGGDFNLLPPNQYATLEPEQQSYYQPTTELTALTKQYACVPTLEDMAMEASTWFSYQSNDPNVLGADRTLDYLFYSNQLNCSKKAVRQHGTLQLSDHFPLIATFEKKRVT